MCSHLACAGRAATVRAMAACPDADRLRSMARLESGVGRPRSPGGARRLPWIAWSSVAREQLRLVRHWFKI